MGSGAPTRKCDAKEENLEVDRKQLQGEKSNFKVSSVEPSKSNERVRDSVDSFVKK